MAHDNPNVFKEMYKGRLIEALRRGNAKRPWWAIVDGRPASPSRLATSTFTSPRLALKCAKDMIDDQIGYLSWLRSVDPKMAIVHSNLDLEEAERMMRQARDSNKVEQARALIDRVKQDLASAEAALKRQDAGLPDSKAAVVPSSEWLERLCRIVGTRSTRSKTVP